MTPSFNLLDEPWLPVRLADGRSANLGLLDTFRRSSEIVALNDSAPPNLVAQYRLLLAILHRALSRALPEGWKDKDRARWYKEGLPVAAVCDYLEHWRERFWLFHSEFPFMQVAALSPFMHEEASKTGNDKYNPKPWTQIALDRTTGNNPVVFDHSVDSAPSEIIPADAINDLLGFLQFKPGGTVNILRGSDNDCALVNTAAIIPVGATLAQILALNLHDPKLGSAPDDFPAWERPVLTIADLRGSGGLATGNNDRYTRQSRAVLFLREDNGNIRWLYFAEGFALEKDVHSPDPMASFVEEKSLTFCEGRAIWRDLPALLPSSMGSNNRASMTLELAARLHNEIDPDVGHQTVMVAGLANKRGQDKLLRWRIEYFVLPVSFLENWELANRLSCCLNSMETLHEKSKELAVGMMCEILIDTENASKESIEKCKEYAEKIFDSNQFSACYFSHAECALPQLLRLLSDASPYELAISYWNQELVDGIKNSWNQWLLSLGMSPRILRADAKFQNRFHYTLKKYAPKEES